MTIYQEQHKPVLNALITLLTLDATALGGPVYYFTTHPEDVVWKTHTHTALPISITGSESKGSGSLPKPTLTMSNVDGTMFAAILAYGDLIGSEITIERTFEQFLDNGSTPNPNAVLPKEYYVVEQKKTHNKFTISWSLTSLLDRNSVKIPRRQVLRKEFPGVSAVRIR